jgi:hypothetical protein
MRTLSLLLLLGVAACGGRNTPPQEGTTAPGSPRTPKTAGLETGAALLQSKAPVEKISIYLDGFHAAKDEPALQMESHHYCNQVNEDFAQCVLFDGNGADARLHGVEYIISAKLYAALPAEERAYWHPHNYEVLSGELRMPGLPDVAEKHALQTKINSYGKTWHFWMTGVHGRPADPLPFGPPHLAWSFNRDGEVDLAMLQARDLRMHLDTTKAREQRADLASQAQPQGGVDALKGAFPSAHAEPPPGVRDNGDASTRAVPTLAMTKR